MRTAGDKLREQVRIVDVVKRRFRLVACGGKVVVLVAMLWVLVLVVLLFCRLVGVVVAVAFGVIVATEVLLLLCFWCCGSYLLVLFPIDPST